jgi:hypothetical protein
MIGLGVQELATDLAGGPQPLLPPTRLLIETGILDRNAGGRGQARDELLILSGERATVGAIGQVKIAEDSVTTADGNAEEGGHWWMVGRDAGRPGVIGHPIQPDGLGISDHCAQQTVSRRQFTIFTERLGIHTHVEELLEQAIGADHSQRRVPRPREISRRVDNAA